MDIYVGSIPFKWNEARLTEIFEAFGEVASAKIIIDKATRQNKGFGFVTMPNDEAAMNAIRELDGSEIDGRVIIVNKSVPYTPKEKQEKPFFKKEKEDKKGWKPFRGNNKGKRF